MALSQRDQLERYREEMGAEAAQRQAKLAASLRSCCGTVKRAEPHDPRCRFSARNYWAARL